MLHGSVKERPGFSTLCVILDYQILPVPEHLSFVVSGEGVDMTRKEVDYKESNIFTLQYVYKGGTQRKVFYLFSYSVKQKETRDHRGYNS